MGPGTDEIWYDWEKYRLPLNVNILVSLRYPHSPFSNSSVHIFKIDCKFVTNTTKENIKVSNLTWQKNRWWCIRPTLLFYSLRSKLSKSATVNLEHSEYKICQGIKMYLAEVPLQNMPRDEMPSAKAYTLVLILDKISSRVWQRINA